MSSPYQLCAVTVGPHTHRAVTCTYCRAHRSYRQPPGYKSCMHSITRFGLCYRSGAVHTEPAWEIRMVVAHVLLQSSFRTLGRRLYGKQPNDGSPILSRVPRALCTVVHSGRVARYTGGAELKQVTLITTVPWSRPAMQVAGSCV